MRVNKHLLFALILLILSFFFLWETVSLNKLYWGDSLAVFYPMGYIYKESVVKYNDLFPLWNPYHMGGAVLWARTDTYALHPLYFPLLMLLPVQGAINFFYIFGIFLAGLFMYMFIFYVTKNYYASLAAAVVYMVNGHIKKIITWGWIGWIFPYALIPLIFLFSEKAVRQERVQEQIKYALIIGVLFALQVFSGTGIVFLYTAHIFALYILIRFFFIKGPIIKRLLILFLLLVLSISTAYCLSAVKIFPVTEYINMSSRGDTTWEKMSSRQVTLNEIVPRLTDTRLLKWNMQDTGDQIGLIATFFLLFAVLRKKHNLWSILFLSLVILAILMATGSPVMYYLWKYNPFFKSSRYLDRALVIWAFSAAALVGIGMKYLIDWLKKRTENKKHITIISFMIVIAIFLNLTLGVKIIGYGSENRDLNRVINSNHILKYISEQPGIFRAHAYETIGIDYGTEFNTVPLGIENLYGYYSMWNREYFNVFLTIANSDPAKFWGIMNMKYMTSMSERNLTGFRFVKKFNESDYAFKREGIDKIDGPYLYENERWLPRAYFTENAVLVVGKERRNMIYNLIPNPDFEPRDSITVLGEEKINKYSLEELKRFKVIILLLGSIEEEDFFLLKGYADSGGILLPDIFNNIHSFSDEDIGNLFKELGESHNPVDDKDIITHSFDKKEIRLNGQTGFLVVSEQYPIYPGWKAEIDGQKTEIMQANGVVTAVYIDEPVESVIFEYYPDSYKKGRMLSIFAFSAIMLYFVFRTSRRIFKKNL